MKTNMIQIKNLKTNEVRSFSSLFEAAKSVAGQKYEKTEQDYIKRLARFQWVMVDDSPAPSEPANNQAIVEQIAKVFASFSGSGVDSETLNKLTNQVEKIASDINRTNNDLNASKENLRELIYKTADKFDELNKKQEKTEVILNAVCKQLESKKVDEVIIKRENKPDQIVKGQHKQFGTLLRILSARLNAILIGPAGSGKTTAAEKVAETLALKYYSMSVGAQTTKFEFFGYMDANGKYVRTLFREAFEKGGIFLIDEMDAGNANVIVSINQALANGICAFPDGMVKKHSDFVVLASANTWGSGASREYVGRNQLDAATKDRFIPVLWEYDTDLEDSMTPNKEWLNEVRRVRRAVEQHKIRQVISPRASIYGSKLLDAGMNWDDVRKMVLLKDMNETEIVNVNNTK